MTTSADFIEACAKLKISVVPAPAEEQQKDPTERSWQTIQNDSAGLLISQRNLTQKHWLLAIFAACTLRACLINESSMLIDSKMAP